MMDELDIEKRLHDARAGVKDDIRGLFRNNPEYRDYLVNLLRDAEEDIKDLRQQVPVPPPED